MKMKKVETRSELEQALAGRERALVLFYSDYCPFCVSFEPAFDAAGDAFQGSFLKACVDGPGALDELFSVDVVPTVLFFSDGRLAKRLDGRLGRGLTAGQLYAFAADCGLGPAGKPGQAGK